jgi:hypothetical protein
MKKFCAPVIRLVCFENNPGWLGERRILARPPSGGHPLLTFLYIVTQLFTAEFLPKMKVGPPVEQGCLHRVGGAGGRVFPRLTMLAYSVLLKQLSGWVQDWLGAWTFRFDRD